MPTASQGVASARRGPSGASPMAPTARPSAAPLPPAAHRPAHARPSPTHAAVSPRGATPTELLPVRRDSSIGATSTNPRLRRGSVIEAAAAHRTSSAPRPGAVDFHAPESKAALRTLRLLFLPVVLRSVLRWRRRAHWRHGEPPRRYTSDSVVSAIASSKTMLSEWPLRVLEQLADEATFHFLGPREFIVYAHESHVSCGIVVLLHGQLEERRPDATGKHKGTASSNGGNAAGHGNSSRPIRTQPYRVHKSTDVLCVMPVLCEDRATSSFVTRDKDEADVAVISSRWFWEVYYSVVHSSLPAAEVLTRYMKDIVAPHRRDIVMADYFPTSVVLLRSWMWPLLTASDRVKLCRAMEVRVLGVGEVLFDEGEYCPYIYFVRRGTLTVIVKGEALAVLEAGACLGEESVLFHEKRNSSVVGSSMCELYALHVRHLEHRLTKYPEVGQRLIAAALERQKRWMEEGKTRDVFGLVSILSGVPCLGHSTDTMREELARCASVRTLPQGHVLASANTPCTSLFVIGRGSLALTSVVKTAAAASQKAPAEGGRPGSQAGRSSSLPPRRRPSSTARNGNLRASISGASPLSPQEVAAGAPPPEIRRELRSAGDYFGELCLKPHLWPFDITCETTVNVWQFERDDVLRVLEQNKADAQAIEVCRQGISLFRAQRGEASLIEGFDAPSTPVAGNGRRGSTANSGIGGASVSNFNSSTGPAARRGSRAPSSLGPSRRRSSSALGGGGNNNSSTVNNNNNNNNGSSASPLANPRASISQLVGKPGDSGVLPPPPLPEASLHGRSPRSSAVVVVDWNTEQWTDYAVGRLQDGLAQSLNGTTDGAASSAAAKAAVPPSRELRPVDKEVEKAMKEKVLQLIAVQPTTSPNPADCDISGDGDELQAIIVEQLFLIPTERQPRFIRQVNDSNVRLVTEEEEPAAIPPEEVPLEEDELRDPWQSGEAPISVGGVMRLEDVDAAVAASSEEGPQMRMLASYSFQGAADTVDSGTIIRSLGENMELSGQVALPPGLGRSRRSMSVAALEDSGAGFMTSLTARNSISRSHFVRPPSGMPVGMPVSPRSNVRNELISPRGMSAMRPGSASEPRVAPPTRTRPTSVDYNQYNKVGVDRSTSVLDRYVKIEDQNYFDNYVKVLPLQQDEIWAPDEVVVEDEVSTGSLILLLLHVRRCDYLVPDVLQRCQRPIVKVTLGQRVLVRTSVFERDATAPHWPIEESSFITFVRRGTEVVFVVCDADDEAKVVYRCALQTAAIHENGGVGQQVMTLKDVPADAAAAAADDAENADGAEANEHSSTMAAEKQTQQQQEENNTSDHVNMGSNEQSTTTAPSTPSRNKTPRLATTMLAVTATKYKALRQALKSDQEKAQMGGVGSSAAAAAAAAPDTTTLYLQVMSVEGLKHRIEASVTVSFYNGGTLRQLLETSQVLPKTRSPAWPGDKAFVKVCGDGGTLTFDLQHKGAVISSAEVAVDNLVFGGVGLRRLPLLQAQTGSAVMGQLVVCVLGASAGGATESLSQDWVTHLAVEELTLTEGRFAITPDPFVVLRDGAGAVRLQTPLVCGAFHATWSAAEASCLLPCPRLSGSTATYHLEVCDSDAQEVVGRASLTLTERGLVGGPQREIALDPPGSGSVRVRSLCQPVLELPETKPDRRPSGGAAAEAVGAPAGPLRRLPPDAAVLLVHVCGCSDLPGGADEEFQTDAVATMTIDRRRYLRTPIREGTTSPRWPFAKASVLLHVSAAEVAALQGTGVGNGGGGRACCFAVYDGVTDEVSQIGQVAVPLSQLLVSAAKLTFPLFAKRKDSDEAADERVRAGDRTVGALQLSTMFGRLGQQVDPAGVEQAEDEPQDDNGSEGAQAVSPYGNAHPTMIAPYFNPDAADALLPSAMAAVGAAARKRNSNASSSGLSGTVLLGVSNVCRVLPNASSKYIHLVVRQGPTPVLSVECQLGTSSHAEWSLTDSSAALSRAELAEDGLLTVELHAMDVVEGKGEDGGPPAKDTAAASLLNITSELRQQTSMPAERVLLGKAELSAAQVNAVGVGEVGVVTLHLENGQRSRPPSKSPAAAATTEGKPMVSFCIIGNRS